MVVELERFLLSLGLDGRIRFFKHILDSKLERHDH